MATKWVVALSHFTMMTRVRTMRTARVMPATLSQALKSPGKGSKSAVPTYMTSKMQDSKRWRRSEQIEGQPDWLAGMRSESLKKLEPSLAGEPQEVSLATQKSISISTLMMMFQCADVAVGAHLMLSESV